MLNLTEKRKIEQLIQDDIEASHARLKQKYNEKQSELTREAVANPPKALVARWHKLQAEWKKLQDDIKESGYNFEKRYDNSLDVKLSWDDTLPKKLKDLKKEAEEKEVKFQKIRRDFLIRLYADEDTKVLLSELEAELKKLE